MGVTLRRRSRPRPVGGHARHRLSLDRLYWKTFRRGFGGIKHWLDRSTQCDGRIKNFDAALAILGAGPPRLLVLALFRWDINFRESAVLGIVGAGGVGVALDTALNLHYWDQVAVVLIAILAVVILAEVLVTMVRARLL